MTVGDRLQFWHDYLEMMPREELESLQETRLLRILHDCHASSPLIRELWDKAGVAVSDIRTIADFKARAPFMDKDTLRDFRDRHDDPFAGLVRRDDPRLRMVSSTSGTTGDSTPLPHSLRALSESAYQRYYFSLGARSGDYILHTTFTFRVGHRHTGPAEGGLIPIVLDHSPAEIPRIVEASLRFRPTVFTTMSSPLLSAFEDYFETVAIDPRDVFKSYKVTIFGGEALSVRQRAIAQGWGLELFEVMNLGDVSIAVECPMHDGAHPHEDLALIECLQPEGSDPMPDGAVGEMVVTMLADPMLPLIRFRTDDLVVIDRTRCGCGRTQMRYKMMGRKSDQLFVKGVQILPAALRPLIDSEIESRAGLFQIIKPSATAEVLRLRVGHNPANLQTSAVDYQARLERKISGALSVDVSVELVSDAELLKLGPPHKIPRVAKQ